MKDLTKEDAIIIKQTDDDAYYLQNYSTTDTNDSENYELDKETPQPK